MELILKHDEKLFALGIEGSEGLDALGERWVRVVHGRVQTIWRHKSRILGVKLDKSRLQKRSVTEAMAKSISLELVRTALSGDEEAHGQFEGHQKILEKHQTDDDRLLSLESKGRVEGSLGDHLAEKIEEGEKMELDDDEALGHVITAPVAKFMTKDGTDLISLHL